MQLELMVSIPAKSNPFDHDYFSMGTQIAQDLYVMHLNFPDQPAKEIYLVNTRTGERCKLNMQ